MSEYFFIFDIFLFLEYFFPRTGYLINLTWFISNNNVASSFRLNHLYLESKKYT